MATEDAHAADRRARCEFGKTLFADGECTRSGEVQLDGSLLCIHHAKKLRLQVREENLLGTVFEMDKWLDNADNRADRLHRRRLLRERDEVVEQLRFNRALIEAHEEPAQ